MSYYIESKAAPHAFKPYDRRRAKRDIHDAGQVSRKLSAAVRRAKREAVSTHSERTA